MKTLYEVTNNILDLNTILVNRDDYTELLADKRRLDWVMPILCGNVVYPNEKPAALARQLLAGKDGREAIDGAMAA